jgi:glycosyltransferase involved in cell wall biosynthesis
MRIAIDATSIPPQPAGAGVYAIELARAMTRRDAHDGYALFTRGSWLDADVVGRKNWRVEHVSAGSRARRLLWEQVELPRALARLGIDVLHSTHHTLPLRPMHARRVVTVHDVTFLRIPQRYTAARRIYMQTLTRRSARVADAIIVPSRTVRGDVVAMLGVPADKIAVVYEAAGEQYRPVDPAMAIETARKYGIDGRYVLSVGSLEPGKNRARLIRAMRLLRDEGVNATLVIVGQRAWKYEDDLALIDDLDMRDRIIMPGYVTAEDLPALYSGATVVALPSLYEGFGLPVIEAMACGPPVLTSNVSATSEVAGDAALLVDPHSLDAIRDGLRTLLSDPDLRAELSKRGLARAAEFSWAHAADETHAVYAGVARGHVRGEAGAA